MRCPARQDLHLPFIISYVVRSSFSSASVGLMNPPESPITTRSSRHQIANIGHSSPCVLPAIPGVSDSMHGFETPSTPLCWHCSGERLETCRLAEPQR